MHIPLAWQYPEIAAACINFKDQSFVTVDFRDGPWAQIAKIIAHNQEVGQVQVVYTLERPFIAGGEGPFRREERELLGIISKRLGNLIEQYSRTEDISGAIGEEKPAVQGPLRKGTANGRKAIFPSFSSKSIKKELYEPKYGNLVEFNANGMLLKLIGEDILKDIAQNILDLIETSAAVYEKNGDYTLGIFSSSWCRFLDQASRDLCETDDNRKALKSGKWLCHESCWTEASKLSINAKQSVDIECHGGLRIYAVPIFADGDAIGSINVGYGNPPFDRQKLDEIAGKYDVPTNELIKCSKSYQIRPSYIFEIAKRNLETAAKLIGTIAERKMTERQLRESEETNRELVEKMQEGVLRSDPCGIITFANPQMADLLDCSAREVVGKPWRDFTHPEIKAKAESEFLKRHNSESSTYESIILSAKGREIPVLVSGTPLLNADSTVRETLAVFTDISSLKHVEDKLRRQKEELSEFAHVMNHDLQNRLHNIAAYASLIQQKKQPAYAGKIKRLVKDISDLMRRSIELADVGLIIHTKEPVDLNRLVLRIAYATIPEGIGFSSDPLPAVTCDGIKIGQAFQNLFENAVIHGKPHNIEVKCQRSHEGLIISITNDGVPIPLENRAKILKKRFSAKIEGKGFGLHIVSKIIDAHDWDISFTPDPKTTFNLLIPSVDLVKGETSSEKNEQV